MKSQNFKANLMDANAIVDAGGRVIALSVLARDKI